MVETIEHIIGKFSLWFDIRSGLFEVENLQDLATYSEKHLIPVLENNLNKLGLADATITIDKMELGLDLSIGEDWENSLNKSFDRALEHELAKLSSSFSTRTTIRVPELAALYHFLEHGSFPWSYSNKSAQDFENACHKNMDLQVSIQLIDYLLKKPVYVKRLLEIFSDKFLHELINFNNVFFKRIPGVDHLRKSFKTANVPEIPKGVFRNLYWRGLLNISKTKIKKEEHGMRQLILFILQRDVSASPKSTDGSIAMSDPAFFNKKIPPHLKHLWTVLIRIEESLRTDQRKKYTRPEKQRKEKTKFSESSANKDFRELISHIENSPNIPTKSEANTAEAHIVPTNTTPDTEDRVYIDHAGIVLVHPFLELFFNKLKLLQEGQWFSPACAKKAVQLLAYMATGKTFCPEYEMVLFKCLCGLPLDTFVGSRLDLSEKDILETDELLFAFIGHWEILKGTSLEGLRTGFFRREGKLSRREEHWSLQVEQKAQDILLSRLPWGLNIVRFPWLPNWLLVVWT